MIRRVFPILAALGLLAVAAPTASAASSTDRLNCSDFVSQAAAQANLRANPSDPNRLDADNDGIACENNRAPFDRTPVKRTTLTTGTGTGTTQAQTGTPNAPVTGDGSGQNPAPLGYALAALLALAVIASMGGWRLHRSR